jgi:hypothetical protein
LETTYGPVAAALVCKEWALCGGLLFPLYQPGELAAGSAASPDRHGLFIPFGVTAKGS